MTKKQLEDWIKEIGGKTKAAAYLGVNRSTLWRWLDEPRRIKKSVTRAIEGYRE